MSNDFDEFIKKQVQPSEKKGLSLEEEKRIWLENLEKLIDLAESSLRTYIDTGAVAFKRSDTFLSEEQLGGYKAPKATITIGRNLVDLKPIGTFLFGARGRLDMVGPRGTVKLVIVPPNSSGARISITSIDSTPSTPTTETPPEKWVWKISTPPPKISYLELNEESFRSALMEVVGGTNG